MCIFGRPKDKKLANPIAQPEKVATDQEIGEARVAEDEALFGGIPDLRVDRSATSGGVATGGSGIRME